MELGRPPNVSVCVKRKEKTMDSQKENSLMEKAIEKLK